ncbi:four helix bundle protein [Candidatus Woesebacteria bacterium]|nr:four helix bundle protein [Candidatus Woesebacteria bacterium]
MVELKIYHSSLDLSIEIFHLLKRPELLREYEIANQLKRAAISVSANISEGYLRSRKVFHNHLSIALGSANEVMTLLVIVERMQLLPTADLIAKYEIICKQITTLRKRINLS